MRNQGLSPARTGKLGKRPRTFAITAVRFREARLAAGFSLATVAQYLRVSLRTVQTWESGTHRIPYAAYKLVRILRGDRYLQHPMWRHWRVSGECLYTPEGHRIHAGELSWWALQVRMARQFQSLMAQGGQRNAARARSAPPLGLSLISTKYEDYRAPLTCGPYGPFNGAMFGATLGPYGVDHGETAQGEAEFSVRGVVAGSCSGSGRPGGNLPEPPAGTGVGGAGSVVGGQPRERGLAGWSGDCGAAVTSCRVGGPFPAGSGLSQGRGESAVSLWLRSEVQALPRPSIGAINGSRPMTWTATGGHVDSPSEARNLGSTAREQPRSDGPAAALLGGAL